MSHTPGPWVAVEQFDENNESLGVLIESPVDEIVRIRDLSIEAYANAHLIASAPDLLAALQLIHANAGESPEWIRSRIDAAIERARAAITKTTQ